MVKSADTNNGWKTGFFILFTITLFLAIFTFNSFQKLKDTNLKLDTANSHISQYNSYKQSCISRAQDLFSAGAGLTDNAAQNLTASVSACEVQYPAK